MNKYDLTSYLCKQYNLLPSLILPLIEDGLARDISIEVIQNTLIYIFNDEELQGDKLMKIFYDFYYPEDLDEVATEELINLNLISTEDAYKIILKTFAKNRFKARNSIAMVKKIAKIIAMRNYGLTNQVLYNRLKVMNTDQIAKFASETWNKYINQYDIVELFD